jgi:hypothetical protein
MKLFLLNALNVILMVCALLIPLGSVIMMCILAVEGQAVMSMITVILGALLTYTFGCINDKVSDKIIEEETRTM